MPILDEEVRPAEVVTKAADPGSEEGAQALAAAPAAQIESSPLGLGSAMPMGLTPPTVGKDEFFSIMGGAAPRISDMWNQTMNEQPAGSALGGTAGRIVAEARKLAGMGIPYRWGQESLGGMDCSGLVQYVYNRMGIKLPRVSYLQARAGKRISLSKLRPGDLVATDNSSRNPGADHIAIYIGGGMIVEAPHPGENVRISTLDGWGTNTWGVRVLA